LEALKLFLYEICGLATTLLDAGFHGWEDLAAIYAQRWDIELRLRDVKTTLGMERFKVKTPEMAHKTLEMMIVAYNLVKATCQEAAQEAEEDLRMMGLKGALDTIVAHTTRYRGRQRQHKKIVKIWREMIASVSEKLIDLRPGRHEPRAIKRRPKPFSYLTAFACGSASQFARRSLNYWHPIRSQSGVKIAMHPAAVSIRVFVPSSQITLVPHFPPLGLFNPRSQVHCPAAVRHSNAKPHRQAEG
jgi:hypothetical protein